ncbi:MAG TPA: sigma 54-interacting transcriptional regulator, partial [Bacteroidota bacterium]
MKAIIGSSKAIQRVRERVEKLSLSPSNIVIIGQPGTGKSVVAQAIHEKSTLSGKPFAMLSVTGTEELKLQSIAQSILKQRQFINPSTSDHGNFALPDGASVIISDVDGASLAAQKIVYNFIAGLIEKGLHIRIILLLSGPAKELVRAKRLMPEIQKRTKDWETLTMPPLRERIEDIPDLVEHFVLETAKEMGIGDVTIDVNAISVLVRKEWKGNVQELKTFVERAMLLSDDKETFMLPEGLLDEQSELTQMLSRIDEGIDFAIDASMELIEKRILERVLRKFGFNQS